MEERTTSSDQGSNSEVPNWVRYTPANNCSVPINVLAGFCYTLGYNVSSLLVPACIGKVGASSHLLPCELLKQGCMEFAYTKGLAKSDFLAPCYCMAASSSLAQGHFEAP